MSRVCTICSKGSQAGNKVSHSNRKSRRTFSANVQKIRIKQNGSVATKYVCTRCLKGNKAERA